LVTKCVTGDFLQLTFNDVGREGGEGSEGQKVLSKPSADSFAVGRRQKLFLSELLFFTPLLFSSSIYWQLVTTFSTLPGEGMCLRAKILTIKCQPCLYFSEKTTAYSNVHSLWT
jgi:hypothetical protein